MKMNENEIQVWNYESSEIRTVQVNRGLLVRM